LFRGFLRRFMCFRHVFLPLVAARFHKAGALRKRV
jgi:hypothetical protein